MRYRSTLGALLAVMAALMVAFASPALAKGGTGGGGGGDGGGGTVVPSGCATIDNWTTSLETVNSQATVVLRFGITNNCVDEGAGPNYPVSVSLGTTDTATGKFVSSFQIGSVFVTQPQTFSTGFLVTDNPPATTLTVWVTRVNGQVAGSRSITYADALQSVQQPAP
jgi:hypothetical protein